MRYKMADKEIQRLKDEIAALPKAWRSSKKTRRHQGGPEKAKGAAKADEAATTQVRNRHPGPARKNLQVPRPVSSRKNQRPVQSPAAGNPVRRTGNPRATKTKFCELMLNVDNPREGSQSRGSRAESRDGEIEKEKNAARDKTAEDEKQLAEWNAKRDKLRRGKSGHAGHFDRVAEYPRHGTRRSPRAECMACQVMLRPQTYNEVRSGERTIVCDSCSRILYYNPAHDAQMTASCRNCDQTPPCTS